MNPDPYDNGTPKYKTALAVYDGLCCLTQTEEMSILSDMYPDVSYDSQDYYYTDKGCDLLEKFQSLSEHGEKMWALDLAILQMDQDEIHDTVYEALRNQDLAKRLDFKRLFIEYMLRGNRYIYSEVSEAYLWELQELDCFSFGEMVRAFNRAMLAQGQDVFVTPYPQFCHALFIKANNLRLEKETQLIAECRALLNSYDDFLLGLRMNQALYESQERQYRMKIAQLEADYSKKVQHLFLIAEKQGILLSANEESQLLLPQDDGT